RAPRSRGSVRCRVALVGRVAVPATFAAIDAHTAHLRRGQVLRFRFERRVGHRQDHGGTDGERCQQYDAAEQKPRPAIAAEPRHATPRATGTRVTTSTYGPDLDVRKAL